MSVPPAVLRVLRADYADKAHARALVDLLDAYALDPTGGGAPLGAHARANLVPGLAARPHAFSVLAFEGDEPAGLVNCFEGFSTFAGRPLVNIHDVFVAAGRRGRGIAEAMLALVEHIARERGACKLTLEVLSGNAGAKRLYARLGFGAYALAPALGDARFWQKPLSP